MPLTSAQLIHLSYPDSFSHFPSPCGFSSFPSSLPFRLPLHHHHAVILPLLSEHMANPFPSSPVDFIADLLYTCCLRNWVVFQMFYSYQILRIHLRHVSWNLSSFFSSAAITSSFHASHPYNRTSCSKVLKSLILYSDQHSVCSRSSNSLTSSLFSLPVITLYFLRVFILFTLHFCAFSFSPTLPLLTTSRLVLFCAHLHLIKLGLYLLQSWGLQRNMWSSIWYHFYVFLLFFALPS